MPAPAAPATSAPSRKMRRLMMPLPAAGSPNRSLGLSFLAMAALLFCMFKTRAGCGQKPQSMLLRALAVRHDRGLEFGAVGLGVGQDGVFQVGPLEIGAPQVGAVEVGAEQIDARKVGVAQVGAAQIGLDHVGECEVGVREVKLPQVEAVEHGAA